MDALHTLRNFDGLDFLEHLYAALDLGGLGLFVSKTTNKLLDALYLLLLTLPGLKEGCKFLRSADFVLSISPHIARERAVEEFVNLPHGDVEKVAVVRDYKDRAAVISQKIFEPSASLQIEVVGGLVEQHDIGVLE